MLGGGICSFGLCSTCPPSWAFDPWPATLGCFTEGVRLEPSSDLRLPLAGRRDEAQTNEPPSPTGSPKAGACALPGCCCCGGRCCCCLEWTSVPGSLWWLGLGLKPVWVRWLPVSDCLRWGCTPGARLLALVQLPLTLATEPCFFTIPEAAAGFLECCR